MDLRAVALAIGGALSALVGMLILLWPVPAGPVLDRIAFALVFLVPAGIALDEARREWPSRQTD